jgi:hypothetical protein
MNSEELREAIYTKLFDLSQIEASELDMEQWCQLATSEIMSLISENCWLKNERLDPKRTITPTTDDWRPVKAIEENKL